MVKLTRAGFILLSPRFSQADFFTKMVFTTRWDVWRVVVVVLLTALGWKQLIFTFKQHFVPFLAPQNDFFVIFKIRFRQYYDQNIYVANDSDTDLLKGSDELKDAKRDEK